ncbi:hypothetical protein ACOSP7_028438 [Xanthoceras sorbifolium]
MSNGLEAKHDDVQEPVILESDDPSKIERNMKGKNKIEGGPLGKIVVHEDSTGHKAITSATSQAMQVNILLLTANIPVDSDRENISVIGKSMLSKSSNKWPNIVNLAGASNAYQQSKDGKRRGVGWRHIMWI